MSKNKIYFFIFLVGVILFLIILSSWHLTDGSFYSTFYKSTSNATFSVIIGLAGVYLGYLIYKIKLFNSYFSEYLSLIFRKLAIRKEEVDLRKEKNKVYRDCEKEAEDQRVVDSKIFELDKERIRNEGEIEKITHLVKKLNRYDEISEIEKLRNNFEERFKEFTEVNCEETPISDYSKEVAKINGRIDCYRKRLNEKISRLQTS